MTATTTPSPLSGGRLAAVIGGVASLVLAALLMLAGTGLLWADSRKDDDGYFSTAHERVATTTYAIATDDLDLDGDAIGDGLYGKVRLQVDGGKPLFAGIAHTRDVDAYLRDSAHTTMTDVDVRPSTRSTATARARPLPAARATQTLLGRLQRGSRHADLGRRGRRLVRRGDERRRLARRRRPRQRRRQRPVPRRPRLRPLDRSLLLLTLGAALIAVTVPADAPRRRRRPSWPAGSASAA